MKQNEVEDGWIIGEEILKKRIETVIGKQRIFAPAKPVCFAGKAKE